MKTKILTLSLCVALIAVAVVGTTLAYFTDTAEVTNALSVGGVAIDLHEDNKEGDFDEDYQEWLEDQVLMPGDNKTNTIAKVITVENTGKSDAYVRVHIAIPSVLDDGADTFDASSNLLHFNAYDTSYVSGLWNWGQKLTTGRTGFVGAGDTWNFYTVEIDDISYNVYVVTYETALAPEATTVSAMHQVYLYKDVTNADIAKADEVLDGNWNVLVFAEACQTEGFSDAFNALNTAFGVPSTTNNPWVD